VRTSFFLHIFYENQHPGGGHLLLYLREAILLAQLMLLHQELSYTGVLEETQQLHSQMLWLLFVTKRGVCLLYKLLVVIKTNISLPLSNIHNKLYILSVFIKLINLFRIFD
jgi:hypothetical protein